MSSVRMCDKCGSIFSENAAGWQTFTGSTFREDEYGDRVTKSQSVDFCPACAVTTNQKALTAAGKKK